MTTDHEDASPQEVLDLAEQARAYVERALSIPLDGTDATLPLLDHYLGQVPRDPPQVAELVTAAAGCYFGELLRARFGGTWQANGAEPSDWTLRLARGALTLHPVALAHRAISKGDDARFDDTLSVSPALRPALEMALSRLAPVEESTYHSLEGRYDALETILDLLAAIQRDSEGSEEPPPDVP